MIAEASETDIRLGISWNELGNAHMLNGNWAKGEECYLQSIVCMRELPDFQPITISLPLANVGLSYWLQGKVDLALTTLLEGLNDRESKYGRDDRVSFITGRFLHALGNVKSDLEYHTRALVHYQATLGNRHHRTADMLTKVAEHNVILGLHDTALALLDYALEAFSASTMFLPERCRAVWMRSKALKGMGKYAEAETERDKAFQIYMRVWKQRSNFKEGASIKRTKEDLTDWDIDDLIVFWSK
jgi:tetratricopeptide (TPR) repeat protein